jgi:two-component system LytT family response regulator
MLPRLRVLIADDEPLARERARRLLERVGDIEIIGECSNGRDALHQIETDPPDVVLLDINMPELDGIRLIEALDDAPAIILATAYEHHAVRAFELEVTDYLLKPYSAERLARALCRVRRQLSGTEGVSGPVSPCEAPAARIPADTGRGIELIPVAELAAARIETSVVFLLRVDGERLCYAGTLQELEQQLSPTAFIRASRRAVVNLNSIERYESTVEGGLLLHLHGGHQEIVSRRRARFFRARFKS